MRAILIENRRSGQRVRTEEIRTAVSRLSSAGWQIDVHGATEVRQVEELAREAVAADVDILIVAGGDGTLNLAVQALAGRRTALGVIPTGTTNVWAREMQIPLQVSAATEVLLTGETVSMDVGRVNGRYFLLVAGIGFDGSVTRTVHSGTKRKLGVLAYLIAGVAAALKLRGEEVTIATRDAVWRERILMLLANNVRLYGGVVQMVPNACADDGLLDILVFRGRGLRAGLRQLLLVLVGMHRRDPDVRFFQATEISVNARRNLAVQLDGDYCGTTPVTIRVEPGALRAVIPRGPHPLLRHRAGTT